VVGDVIVDHYRVLSAAKLSPEAPVIIFKPSHEEYRAGGAANVANNLEALGAKSRLFAIAGDDWDRFGDVAKGFSCTIIKQKGQTTTIKERLVTARQQVVRVDHQPRERLDSFSAAELESAVIEAIPGSSAIIFSDYDHGSLRDETTQRIIFKARELGVPVVVDSKAKETIARYKGATMALPNHHEAKMITGLEEFDDEHVARFMLRTMGLQAIGVKSGPRGILFADKGGNKMYPALEHEDEVVDVTGAGDTVTATVAAGMSLGMAYDAIMRLANVSAGIVIRKMGTATASRAEVEGMISSCGLTI
jgi:D-beta-D-heptose 7-phosphate kinase/D-beta-D-heptose 1-phosphate adenosyltransferase